MKAIILTSQRSGSTFMQGCLDAHPQVRCYGELLVGGNLVAPRVCHGYRLLTKGYRYLAARAWDPVGIMDRYYAREEAPVVVFKAMYSHVDNQAVRKYLQKHTEIRVIHLRRDNLLKQYVSKVLLGAKRERRWQPHTTHRIPVVSARVSPERAIREMTKVRDYFLEFERLLSGHRKIEILYERMFHGPSLSREVWAAIGGLLEIEPAQVGSDLVKMNPNDLRPMVDNYDELADALAGTEFAKYLDEQPAAPANG
jgi:LPS sulfotransferase NodH